MIDAERGDRPVWDQYKSAFQSALRDQCQQPVDVYFENLDLTRLGADGYLSRVEAWLVEKYRNVSLDVVVAAGPLTYKLMADSLQGLAAGAPMVVAGVSERTVEEVGRLPHSAVLLSDIGHVDSVGLALELLPDTRNLAVIGGARETDPHARFFFSQIAAAYAERLHIIDLSGLPMGELRRRVTDLPNHTVAILTSMFVDGDGRPFSNPEIIAELAPVANAPFFSAVSTELGCGTVGGCLFDGSTVGRDTAALVARILRGEVPERIEPVASKCNVVAFDWRQLRRWHIAERKLPPGSVVEFRPESLWHQHREVVLGVLAVIGLQGASIIALLRSRNRRRRINRELHRLSGRLITAQEDERRRVARELHDDISQRLALLAIELESSGGAPIDRLSAATSKVQEIARDVHSLAHDLQPPRLDARGLVAELEGFCAEVEERQDVTIDFRAPVRPITVPPDAALALYRVAQEAVQNAVKHSGADQIMVELATSPRWASITITDNGRGFQKDDAHRGRGLGLAGMEERARLVGGWLEVASEPGSGAVVSAWVPMRAPERVEEADGPTADPDR